MVKNEMVKNEAIEEFVQAIQQPQAQSGTTYSAIVARIDDEGVVWVNLAGSNKETPTASISSEVEKGDSVTVEWRNNKLYISGNYSNPSAGTARVSVVEKDASIAKRSAEQAVNDAVRAYEAAEQAVYDAGRAAEAAESAEANALASAQSASSAQQSATSAGVSASQAQAASQAAQAAALGSITTDTIHYLATDLDSGITTANPPAGHGTWSTTVQTMTSTNKYLWTYHTYTTAGGSSTDTSPVITGTYGERGEDGTSVTILGSYNTLAELQAAHPTGSLGDAYMVAGDLYIWNGSAWENVGQIQGPQGPQGIQGNSITISSIAYAVTATDDAPLTYPYSTVPTVPEGSWLWTKTTYSDGSAAITKAKQGKSGTNGTNGTNGRDGTDGEDGVSVTAVQPQYYLSTSDSSATGGSWSTSLTYVVGKFIWTRDYITYSDNSHSTSQAIYNEALTQSCENAAGALGLIEEQQEYFWHDSLGAHVLSDKDTVSGTRYRTDIKGAGLEIFELDGQNDTSTAKFGSATRLGQTDNVHVEIDEDSFLMLDGSGNEFAHIGSPKDVQLTDTFVYAGTDTFTLSNTPSGTVMVQVNGTTTTNFTLSGTTLTITRALTEGDRITATYTVSAEIKYYSMGLRIGNAGEYSMAEGYNTTASGMYSHAEGRGTFATGAYSHAEGYGLANTGIGFPSSTRALGNYSHAEGYGSGAYGTASHAEGNHGYAGGIASHAEGYNTFANGNYSHAQNEHTYAQAKGQTALGTYNVSDTTTATTHPNGDAGYGTHAVIIGNGTALNARNNALAVTWDGNVELDLAGYQTTGNVDKTIYDALVSLGWDSEVTA